NASAEALHGTPGNFRLFEAYPNPFNTATRIRYRLPKPDFVILTVYDLHGKKVETVVHEPQAAGEHEAAWQPKDCSSGSYFFRLKVGGLSETGKAVLLK
ncbi:T9SS type A sorting domain-containing protein, partial [bacterium]|nr:T9SS type A sorting domain-containing protein [bacterium]